MSLAGWVRRAAERCPELTLGEVARADRALRNQEWDPLWFRARGSASRGPVSADPARVHVMAHLRERPRLPGFLS